MSLWTAQEAAAATDGQILGDWHNVTGLSIDSRSLQAGDMFIALKAARDGHDFVGSALENGAACALVSHVPEGLPESAPLLLVRDVQSALDALGKAARARMSGKVLAITGSVGKTSTKEMAAHVLRRVAGVQNVHAAVKSFNNHWGVPLTLARMPRDVQFAVIEIGMNHPGEIEPLVKLAQPHVAMITTVGPVHLEAFEDGEEGIAREKAAIFKGLVPNGLGIWNGDVLTAPILIQELPKRDQRFGVNAVSDWRLMEVRSGKGLLSCVAMSPQGPILYKIGAPGQHFALNGLAVLAAMQEMGVDLAQACQALTDWSPPAGRGARHFVALDAMDPSTGIDLIDDSYNANPSSVAAGLRLLADVEPPKGGRRVAMLGDMKELGPKERQMHAGLANLPSVKSIDQVHCVGPLMAHLWEALPQEKRGLCVSSSQELAVALKRCLQVGDTVLVKGSFSMEMGHLVDVIRALGQSARK